MALAALSQQKPDNGEYDYCPKAAPSQFVGSVSCDQSLENVVHCFEVKWLFFQFPVQQSC